MLHIPVGIAVDSSGNVYVVDNLNDRVRKINTSGIITTIAGNGSVGYSGDCGPATNAMLNWSDAVAVDHWGNVYIAGANTIRKVNTSGIITTVVGNGSPGFSGDGGPATAAMINNATGVTFDASGNMYICDFNNSRIRKINSSGIISTFAGNGTYGYSGDGGPASAASMSNPTGVFSDCIGKVNFTDYYNNVVRYVNEYGIISTIAGTGTGSFCGDGGLATMACLNNPDEVIFDPLDNGYIADFSNHRIRKISNFGDGGGGCIYTSTVEKEIFKQNKSYSIYPNPNNGTIIINDNISEECVHINMKNSVGQTIFSNNINFSNGKYELTLPSNVVSGFYLLEILDTNGNYQVLKTVIQK